jgi:hypothetical protein
LAAVVQAAPITDTDSAKAASVAVVEEVSITDHRIAQVMLDKVLVAVSLLTPDNLVLVTETDQMEVLAELILAAVLEAANGVTKADLA